MFWVKHSQKPKEQAVPALFLCDFGEVGRRVNYI
jgi:hypothetical protein